MKKLTSTFFIPVLLLSSLLSQTVIAGDDTKIDEHFNSTATTSVITEQRVNYSIEVPTENKTISTDPYDSEGNLATILIDNLNSEFNYY